MSANHMTIEQHRLQMIDQLIADSSPESPRTHEEKVAAALLGLDMLDPAQAGIRYTKTVGKTTVTAQVSYEACVLSAQVQQLVDRLNASCDPA